MTLPQDLQRALSDKVYERRKAAALQIEQLTRALVARGDAAAVDSLLADLSSLARTPTNANARKGGALALAATAVALAPAAAGAAAGAGAGTAAAASASDGAEGATAAAGAGPSSAPPPASSDSASRPRRAPELVTGTLLDLLDDRDARVRYYAAEACYNVARVASSAAAPYPALLASAWPAAFAASLGLAADADAGVRQAGLMLDRALRDAAAVPGALDCGGGVGGESATGSGGGGGAAGAPAPPPFPPGLQLLLSVAAALRAPSAAARRTATA